MDGKEYAVQARTGVGLYEMRTLRSTKPIPPSLEKLSLDEDGSRSGSLLGTYRVDTRV
jgi:hypothetical protein